VTAYGGEGSIRLWISRVQSEQEKASGTLLEQTQKLFLRLRSTNAVAGRGNQGTQSLSRSRSARKQQNIFGGSSQRNFLARRDYQEKVIRGDRAVYSKTELDARGSPDGHQGMQSIRVCSQADSFRVTRHPGAIREIGKRFGTSRDSEPSVAFRTTVSPGFGHAKSAVSGGPPWARGPFLPRPPIRPCSGFRYPAVDAQRISQAGATPGPISTRPKSRPASVRGWACR
jgi:hypothetical protein